MDKCKYCGSNFTSQLSRDLHALIGICDTMHLLTDKETKEIKTELRFQTQTSADSKPASREG